MHHNPQAAEQGEALDVAAGPLAVAPGGGPMAQRALFPSPSPSRAERSGRGGCAAAAGEGPKGQGWNIDGTRRKRSWRKWRNRFSRQRDEKAGEDRPIPR